MTDMEDIFEIILLRAESLQFLCDYSFRECHTMSKTISAFREKVQEVFIHGR